jgi:hypothetical protein
VTGHSCSGGGRQNQIPTQQYPPPPWHWFQYNWPAFAPRFAREFSVVFAGKSGQLLRNPRQQPSARWVRNTLLVQLAIGGLLSGIADAGVAPAPAAAAGAGAAVS